MDLVSSIIFSVITGIVSGVVSSILVHLFLRKSTPNIIISKEIEVKTVDGKSEYHIKVVNSRKRFAVNVQTYLDLIHTTNGVNGPILRMRALHMHSEEVPYIDPYCKGDNDHAYAVRCCLPDSLMSDWGDDDRHYLQFKIYCIDEFSGAGKLFTQKYYKHDCLRRGQFENGMSLKIIDSKK